MGIESDKVVYEYLSRVGDIAQQRQLPSSARMRLVSELRNEIDRDRAKVTVDSPAAVRRILDRLGSPDEVVDAAGGGAPGGSVRPSAAVPAQPAPRERAARPEPAAEEQRPKLLRRVVPRPRPTEPEPAAPRDVATPPHLAAAHELGDTTLSPDWWRVADGPFGGARSGPATDADAVPGFVGGVEIPDLLKRPPHETEKEKADKEKAEKEKAEKEKAGEAEESGAAPARRFGLFPRRAPAPAADAPARRLLPGPAGGWTNPLLLLAAAALVAGAVLGNWFALVGGWAIAYTSRRLSPAEAKWAVLVLPGTVAAAGLVWLWGRQSGRWGDPIAQGQMSDAISQTWPWVVRGAAVASALYLVWRSQRRS